MSALLKIATRIWEHTPSRALREKYFATYCWLVRGRKLLTTIDGVTLQLDLSETIDVAVHLRRFEPEIVEAIRSHTRAGDTIFDIGANAGIHALAFAAHAYPGGKVYAFEPTNYAYARLVENIRLNPTLAVEAIRLAVSDRNLPPQDVEFRSSWRTDRIVERHVSTVEFRSLDDWIRDKGISSVGVVKIDVDGHEYPVVRGAAETLKRFLPTIFIEVGLDHFEHQTRDPIDFLGRIGYRFWDAKTKRQHSHQDLRRHLAECNIDGFTMNVIASARERFRP